MDINEIKSNIVSYWTVEGIIPFKIFDDNNGDDYDFFVVYGLYNHLNEATPRTCIGMCWFNFPKARNNVTITPLALPYETSIDTLTGMLLSAVRNNDSEKSHQIQKGIDFLIEHHDKK